MSTGIVLVVDGGKVRAPFPLPPCILTNHEFCSRARIFKLFGAQESIPRNQFRQPMKSSALVRVWMRGRVRKVTLRTAKGGGGQ